MTENDRIYPYFEWLCDIALPGDLSKNYTKLLEQLFETNYICSKKSFNHNRLCDGLSLRNKFYREYYKTNIWNNTVRKLLPFSTEIIPEEKPCSILELIVAICLKMEGIMSDSSYGDRTHQWFWIIIVSLGLGKMENKYYDEKTVDKVLKRFMNNEYSSDGKGGLFTILNFGGDMRTLDIWTQMCYFLNTIS